MDIQSVTGSLTIIDANEAAPKLYWNGELLSHVLSATTHYNPPSPRKVTIRVIAPAKVVPTLTPTEQLRLTALYDAMTAANITLFKV